MSKGQASRPKLSEALFEVLVEQELAKGPVAHGWPDHVAREIYGRIQPDRAFAAPPAAA
ncbi:hypothetical protein [Streptomyces sp. NPDC006668]|uniref:hypothetical protein n=1 Tax=Streptomyces sp. NPDC006668 TaxID=3156903 RepID=UPI0033D7DA93